MLPLSQIGVSILQPNKFVSTRIRNLFKPLSANWDRTTHSGAGIFLFKGKSNQNRLDAFRNLIISSTREFKTDLKLHSANRAETSYSEKPKIRRHYCLL